ncbi:hypothetical protein OPV22_025939 [Ensete ventricosum]|uniref:Protein kinase domain-containing protein n=1 Tax=Ensete ventricosum TaxID=4639 RepID=A0AAV8PA60_ENSVE|nr:hypothetical protein OPV22_025939 [Ensete ventricosum]RWW38465.1 hypothetical protein BHE74_00056301 [Ensete ventricosum]RZS26868.1 hypothetical protein BHM03_00060274 [Ensete ventricosum]
MEGRGRRDSRSWVRGRIIGSGSFGTVCLALDESSGEVFAVKSVPLHSSNPAPTLALDNEIRLLKSLRSPYVVEYLGDDTSREARSGECRNLHMEYMPCGTAADLATARKKGNCPMDDELEVRAYARCVACALRYLHDVADVVHCDVKGRNVLLGRAPGVAKLADFGAAVRISDGGQRNRVRGTPLWMAPEVARGERPRPASDVWSLGCTVIEMATGAQPWPDYAPKDAEAAMFFVGYGDKLPEFPPWMSELGRDFLDKCLRRNATERWTAEQLLRHPFLAEADIETPRGVLEWANSEFRDDDDDDCSGENCSSTDYRSVADSVDLMACGGERVRELASSGGIMGWDSDGWEEVRSAEEVNWAGDGRRELVVGGRRGEGGGGRTWSEYSNCCSVGMADEDRAVSAASPPCCCCSGGLVCLHGTDLKRKVAFGWCGLLLLLHVKVDVPMHSSSSFIITTFSISENGLYL